MQCADLIRQILDINKKMFESSMSAMVSFQEHSEKMINDFWVNGLCLPPETRKVTEDWLSHSKAGLAEYQENVNKRFKLMEYYLLGAVNQMETSFNEVKEKKAAPEQNDQKADEQPAVAAKIATPKKMAVGKKATTKKK